VESDGPTPGLLMVGGVGAGTDSSVERRGGVSKGARDKIGVGTARVPAAIERLEVVHGQGGSAVREDVRWMVLIDEGWLWREVLAFDARIFVGRIFVGVISRVRTV